jgi:hypothetical protein
LGGIFEAVIYIKTGNRVYLSAKSDNVFLHHAINDNSKKISLAVDKGHVIQRSKGQMMNDKTKHKGI